MEYRFYSIVCTLSAILFICGCTETTGKSLTGTNPDPWADSIRHERDGSQGTENVDSEVQSKKNEVEKDLYSSGAIIEGNTFINFLGMTMKWVPSGRFIMGREESSQRMKVPVNGTWPLRTVAVSSGFWICTKEVTQAQYRQLRSSNPSYFKGDNRPVDSVSWKEAVQFCDLMTERQNEINLSSAKDITFQYSLPSEAQWEYACRGGTTSVFYSKNLETIAWYFPNSGNSTHDVGLKAPNAWGLYDMMGNVEEWCLDKFAHTYHGAPLDESPRLDLPTIRRTIRGGSFASMYVKEISSSARKGAGPSYRYSRTGFRPVLIAKRSR